MNKINFKKWAFKFTIWILIINVITFILTINYVGLTGVENSTGLTLFYFGIFSTILLFLSVIAIILSTIKKEKKNYQYWISIIGIFVFGLLPFLASFF